MRLVGLIICWIALPLQAGQHFLLTVSGIGGLDEYQHQFDRLALQLQRAASAAGFADSNLFLLSPEPIAGAAAHRRSDLEGIEQALSEIHSRSKPGDQIILILLGHGNPRGDSALFNLPGPDLSADELNRLLQNFTEYSLVVVNTAAASGPFIKALTRPGRVVITATSGGHEYHAALFGEHFVAALTAPGADRDKDEKVSMLEAFDYARREVRRAYDADKRLLTEHALLDDNGDGIGSLEPGEFGEDGRIAKRLFLQPQYPQGTLTAQVHKMLLAKQTLEQSISDLRQQRDGFERSVYYDRLESLLIDLALLTREIKAQGG